MLFELELLSCHGDDARVHGTDPPAMKEGHLISKIIQGVWCGEDESVSHRYMVPS